MFRSPATMAGVPAVTEASAASQAASHFRLRSVFSALASREGTYRPMTRSGPPGAGVGVGDVVPGGGDPAGQQLASGAGLGLGEDQDVLVAAGEPGQLPLGA